MLWGKLTSVPVGTWAKCLSHFVDKCVQRGRILLDAQTIWPVKNVDSKMSRSARPCYLTKFKKCPMKYRSWWWIRQSKKVSELIQVGSLAYSWVGTDKRIGIWFLRVGLGIRSGRELDLRYLSHSRARSAQSNTAASKKKFRSFRDPPFQNARRFGWCCQHLTLKPAIFLTISLVLCVPQWRSLVKQTDNGNPTWQMFKPLFAHQVLYPFGLQTLVSHCEVPLRARKGSCDSSSVTFERETGSIMPLVTIKEVESGGKKLLLMLVHRIELNQSLFLQDWQVCWYFKRMARNWLRHSLWNWTVPNQIGIEPNLIFEMKRLQNDIALHVSRNSSRPLLLEGCKMWIVRSISLRSEKVYHAAPEGILSVLFLWWVKC